MLLWTFNVVTLEPSHLVELLTIQQHFTVSCQTGHVIMYCCCPLKDPYSDQEQRQHKTVFSYISALYIDRSTCKYDTTRRDIAHVQSTVCETFKKLTLSRYFQSHADVHRRTVLYNESHDRRNQYQQHFLCPSSMKIQNFSGECFHPKRLLCPGKKRWVQLLFSSYYMRPKRFTSFPNCKEA